MEIIGHRGNGQRTTENTLIACLTALHAGAKRLELDVQLVDDEVIFAHPPVTRSDRLQNILDNLTAPLVLHVKRRHASPQHDRRALRAIAPLIAGRDVTVSSFWPGTLTYAARHHPTIRTAFLTFWAGYDLHLSRRLGAAEFHAWHKTLNPAAVRLAHQKNLKIVAFVPSGKKDAVDHIVSLQVDGVIVDDVALYVQRFGGA